MQVSVFFEYRPVIFLSRFSLYISIVVSSLTAFLGLGL